MTDNKWMLDINYMIKKFNIPLEWSSLKTYPIRYNKYLVKAGIEYESIPKYVSEFKRELYNRILAKQGKEEYKKPSRNVVKKQRMTECKNKVQEERIAQVSRDALLDDYRLTEVVVDESPADKLKKKIETLKRLIK
jgi:hypothetical protein